MHYIGTYDILALTPRYYPDSSLQKQFHNFVSFLKIFILQTWYKSHVIWENPEKKCIFAISFF